MTRYFLLGRPRFTVDVTFMLCCNSRCIRLRLSTFIKCVAHAMQRKIVMPAVDVMHTSADLLFSQTSQLYFTSNNRKLPTKRVNSSSVKLRTFIAYPFYLIVKECKRRARRLPRRVVCVPLCAVIRIAA